MRSPVTIVGLVFCFTAAIAVSQGLELLRLSPAAGVTVTGYTTGAGDLESLTPSIPLFSFLLNDTLVFSTSAFAHQEGDSLAFRFARGLAGSVKAEPGNSRGWKATVIFRNSTVETLSVANVVPFGEGSDRVYITAAGPADYIHRLSRSALFRPGYGPVGVVLPDDAWEMGFCDISVPSGRRLVAVARRKGSTRAVEHRFTTSLPPGGSVRYDFYADVHAGDWHQGIRMMFHDRWLYDLESFNDSLFHRADLAWIRHSYLATILFGWDRQYYDRFEGKYHFDEFLVRQKTRLGPYDIFMIWPTWPRLGMDERNQFDLYHDMPGGLEELRQQSEFMHNQGKKYFVSYNPWDESTRSEDHLRGMKDLLRATDADGVVLDTWGNSSREFQQAADSVKPGVIMYSEGMAIPSDMPLIVAGRVHDAIYLPPPLNMNKVIKPDFAIFRVMQVKEGRLHREGAICLFNGYGVELNVMGPGRPDWMDEEYAYLGRVVRTLKEHSNAFLSDDWQPLLPVRTDSVWVNRWPEEEKTVYTVYGARPEGFEGPLFEVPAGSALHYVSVWHHEELRPVEMNGRAWIPATVEGFSASWLDTRREGNVDCIVGFPTLLNVRLDGDSLSFGAARGDSIRVTAGNPSYANEGMIFDPDNRTISLYGIFGRYEGKFVIQLYAQGEVIDERTATVPLATPRLISRPEITERTSSVPAGMDEVPAGTFLFSTTLHKPAEAFIPYPDFSKPRAVKMPRFFIDTYPVTNRAFKRFLDATRYRPKDTANFLRHWKNGKIPASLGSHPVVWVSLEDARAYARWAGKRLPTTIEWQYAAQGTDGRKYPWGNRFDSTRCNNRRINTTPVDAFPGGKGPFGTMDLVGNVWQMTADIYDNISYYFQLLRGGSYFNPTSSIWYVHGGPWQVDEQQILLLLSPGFDRNATLGFRCVKDALQ